VANDREFRERLAAVLGPDCEIGELVGQGGFGRVYAARDRRLDRRLAVKVIRPDLAGATAFLDRFRREGVALARLRHPAIVPIYDIRESEGLIVYTMPFIDGPTLAAKLDQRGPLPPRVAQRILAELCDAVAATHRAGILHRDIKPANVILEGPQEKVLLMDFGIARLAGADELTESGVLMGTPTYMSPEQVGGGPAVDERSDIYSLGVVGFHLVTGRPPFSGNTPSEVMMQHVSSAPMPVRRINPSVPLALADAIERALEKSPDDRFPSVREMFEQVQGVTFFREVGGEPVPDHPVWIGRSSAVLGAVAASALLTGWLAAAGRSAPALAAWQWFVVGGGSALLAAIVSPRVRLWISRWRGRR
jgi:eukaryotic-like serine/threonine-protein kinase